jgi:hypothetical protein
MQMQAEYEFMIEGVRRPALAKASSAWQATLNTQLQAVMESLESPSPKADARLILAVLAGLEVDQLATELQASDARMIREVLRRLLLSLELAWRAGESARDH